MPAISHIEIRIASRATVEIGTTTAKPVRCRFRTEHPQFSRPSAARPGRFAVPLSHVPNQFGEM